MARFTQRVTLCLGCLLLTVGSQASADERIWTDKSGKFQLSAELVDVVDGKARLKRPDGRIVNVPVDRLSEADQQHLKTLPGAGEEGATANGAEEPLKAGDKVYLQVRGQWQLGVISKLLDGPGSARFEVTLKTGKRRTLKVAEKRLRRYGKAGDHGMLLPGDVVEILDTWGTKVVNTGVVARVKGDWAYVVPEGGLGEKSYRLSSLRAPGSGGKASLEGRVTSAAESNRKPGEQAHPADKLTYPDPELTPVNFASAQPIELTASGAPASITIERASREFDARSMRRLPVKLTPEKDAFWDKFIAADVSADGALGAALKTTGKKQSQLELVPLTKTRSEPRLFGLPPGTIALELAPGGRLLTTRRGATWGRQPKVDLWRVAWEDETRKKISGFEHVVSWEPVEEPKSESLEAVRWLDNERYLTLDSKKRLTVWEAATATPIARTTLGGPRGGPDYELVTGSDLLAIGQGTRGVTLLNLRTLQVDAVIGAERVSGSRVSVSPSGTLMVVTNASRVSQFWDLASGEMLLEAMLVPQSGGAPKWSHEEGVILLGLQPVDIRTWKPLPPMSLAKRSYDGVAWSVVEKKGTQPLFGGTPVLPPVAEAGLRPNAQAGFALEPGDGIALQVKTESAITEATRRRFAKMIEDQGFRVDDTSPFRLTLSTKVATESQEYGQSISARRGDKGNFTVSYQVRSYSTSFSLDGTELLSDRNGQSPGIPMLFTNEEAVRKAASQAIPPDANLFKTLELPKRVLRIQE